MAIRHHLLSSRRWRGGVAGVLLGAFGVAVAPPPLNAHAASPAQDERSSDSHVEMRAPDPITEMPDLRQYAAGPERKRAFFELLVPLVEAENAEIQAQRDWLLEARAQQDALSDAEQAHLQRLCTAYEIECGTPNTFEYLLSRVDTVPLEMVAIQAVEESGWGTSRYARQGNNLFGLRCFSDGCGLAQAGSERRYQQFASVQESVEYYLHNLNTHQAYLALRQKRAALTASGESVTAKSLIHTLDNYSVSDDYFDVLLALLRTNADLIRQHSEGDDSPA
ncbi:Bax protein [Chromohalobacter marismortui]|uniref:Bax protein n=1 Tax=Chromohalobacter marismortui TaxID=42055 RepID=A0A4R7NJI0_9GAMM|nr:MULTISPECIES: protein bax [Chromohalobacter]MCI0511469.1 protein bax [Chromohalobacter sp.]MCI0594707.1 protein bax [Chromohalobacter sp.]TDU20410.1 Bax protein [Chromohalobacter marismortui]